MSSKCLHIMEQLMAPASILTSIIYKPIYAIQAMYHALPWLITTRSSGTYTSHIHFRARKISILIPNPQIAQRRDHTNKTPPSLPSPNPQILPRPPHLSPTLRDPLPQNRRLRFLLGRPIHLPPRSRQALSPHQAALLPNPHQLLFNLNLNLP